MNHSISHQTLRRLTYFATIAETGSIRGAAERLGLSVPVLSEALSELEAELGVTLANRTTRRFELTDTGQSVAKAAAEMLRLGQSVKQYASPERYLEGRLSITLPVELATHWIVPHIARFQKLHKGVRFDIDASDHVTALKNSPHDLAIRTTYIRPGLPFPDAPYLPLCCVSGIEPEMTHLSDVTTLTNSAIITPSSGRSLLARDPVSGKNISIVAQSELVVNNRSVAISMAKQGLGVTLVLTSSVQDSLQDGSLLRLLPQYDFGAISLEYVYRDTLPSPAAKAFVAFLGKAAA